MTPTEQQTLRDIGTDTLHTFVAIVFHTFTYTIYMFVAIKAFRLSLRMARGKFSVATFIVLIAMFVMATVLLFLDIINFITETVDTLVHAELDAPIDVQLDRTRSRIFHRLVVTDLLYAYMCVLGDAVVIWRVKVLWSNTSLKWVMFVPWSFLFGSVACAAVLTYCGAHPGADIQIGQFHNPPFCKNVQTASYAMTFATTAVATGLIAYKVWQYRRLLAPIVNSTTGRVTWVEKMLTLLLESGIIYLLFFLVQIISTIPGVESKNGSSFAFQVYSYSTSVIVGLYPTIIVVLAHSQRAVLDAAATTHATTAWRAPAGRPLENNTEFWNNSRDLRSTTTPTANNIEVNLTPYIKSGSYHSKMADEIV